MGKKTQLRDGGFEKEGLLKRSNVESKSHLHEIHIWPPLHQSVSLIPHYKMHLCLLIERFGADAMLEGAIGTGTGKEGGKTRTERCKGKS